MVNNGIPPNYLFIVGLSITNHLAIEAPPFMETHGTPHMEIEDNWNRFSDEKKERRSRGLDYIPKTQYTWSLSLSLSLSFSGKNNISICSISPYTNRVVFSIMGGFLKWGCPVPQMSSKLKTWILVLKPMVALWSPIFQPRNKIHK